MLRTTCFTRHNGEYHLVDVLASIKVHGYVFLVHRCVGDSERFTATYAPVGSCAGERSNIENLSEYLFRVEKSRMDEVIKSAVQERMLDHLPELAPETGIITNDWRWREKSRLDSGEYQKLPVNLDGYEIPADHFVHLSVTKTESDFIAYTPSADYGERDRQVRMKFGKYLKKTFPNMYDAAIQAAVVELRAKLALAAIPAELRFATDISTINEIFETRMCARDSDYASCMYGKFADQAVRPYHVYADSPDVAMAYLVEFGEIVARTVVSTRDKEWIRLYAVNGDSTKCRVLAGLLNDAGYSEGDLEGNRLTKLDTRNVMLPYIDEGGKQVSDRGKYWVVVKDGKGDYEASNMDGTASEVGPRCDVCERHLDDCECYVCECCDSRTQHGCEDCFLCEQCNGCREHGGCDCNRCDECHEIINPRSRYTTECECDRCSECSELVAECECEPEDDEDGEDDEDEVTEKETEKVTETCHANNQA